MTLQDWFKSVTEGAPGHPAWDVSFLVVQSEKGLFTSPPSP